MKKYFVPAILLTLMGTGCGSRDFRGDRFLRVHAHTASLTVSRGVRSIDAGHLRSLMTRRHGKFLVLNFWATWCLPCVHEIPDLARIARAYRDSSIEVVGVSLDDPEDRDAKLVPFIRANRIPYRIYLAQFEHQDAFINSIDSTWNGAIPATVLYDTLGQMKGFIVGEQTYDQFKHDVDHLRSGS